MRLADGLPAEEPERCLGCGEEIDPSVCHCGDYMDQHTYNHGHSPVPMGCMCWESDSPAPYGDLI